MKNKLNSILIIILLFNYSLFVRAQNKFVPEISVGFKLGADFSKIRLDTIIGQNFLNGYSGGIVFRAISEPHVGIQIELNYAQKGWSEKLDSSDVYREKLNYFDFPVMTRIEIGGGKTNVTLDFGLYFSYFISRQQTENITHPKAIKNYYGQKIDNDFEYGICFGIGVLRKTPIGNFEVEIRFSQGLSNIFDANKYPNMSTSQNQVFTGSLSYLIKL